MRITSIALMIGFTLLLTGSARKLTAQESGEPTLAPPAAKGPGEQASPEDKPSDSKPVAEKSGEEKNSGANEPESIDVDELLRQLEMVIRDPFSPDRAIVREQKKANNEFVEVTGTSALPVLELVCYAERPLEGTDELDRLVGLKIEGRVYFVRKDDQVTLPRTGGNLVIQISSIEKGFVEVKIGTLKESIIVR